MRFSQRILIVAVGTAALVFSAAAARAHVYDVSSINVISPASQGYAGRWRGHDNQITVQQRNGLPDPER